MQKKVLVFIILTIVAVSAAWFFVRNGSVPIDTNTSGVSQNVPLPQENVPQAQAQSAETNKQTTEAVITYTNSGFSPSALTVAKGTTIVVLHVQQNRFLDIS